MSDGPLLYKKGDIVTLKSLRIPSTNEYVVLFSERFQRNYEDLLISDYYGEVIFDVSENIVKEKTT
jgi:hypothetical protein